MSKYLITFKPLEPYFFGGERTFGFGSETARKPPYYIVSENAPSQPTLFGTLRYIILSQNDALYGQKNANEAAELVGAESFSFKKAMQSHFSNDETKKQTFGKINKISPLFLVKDGVWCIPTPFDHKSGDKDSPNRVYTPFTMMESASVVFGNGFSFYPADYVAKEGYGGGCLSLKDKSIIPDSSIFISCERTGINSHRTEDTSTGIRDDGSFFKKLRKRLADGFAFAIIADLSCDLETGESVVFMGQDKSPFLCNIAETDKDLKEEAESALKSSGNISRKFALSDIVPLKESFNGEEFSYYIAEAKVLRNLESKVNANNAFERYSKSDKLYKLIRGGSIFITEQNPFENAALEKIGMNILIDIKGVNV